MTEEERMGIPLGEMMARLPPDRRRRVEARTEALIAEEMSLRDLRKALGKTQTTVAQKLGMKQENVSRFEQRADMLLSTLNTHLRALGGQLHLVVEFKGRAPVRLAGLTAIEAKQKAPTRRGGGRVTAKRSGHRATAAER
jgi:hypothetical protein